MSCARSRMESNSKADQQKFSREGRNDRLINSCGSCGGNRNLGRHGPELAECKEVGRARREPLRVTARPTRPAGNVARRAAHANRTAGARVSGAPAANGVSGG